MTFTRVTNIDVNAGGDTVKQGITKADEELTEVYNNLNIIDAYGATSPTADKMPFADANGKVDLWVRQACEGKLDYTSATVLTFSRKNGYRMLINDTVVSIPAAGVTLSNSGLSSSTLYYIYAYMNAGTMTLEASTTGYTVNSTNGMPCKTGDATRTLVGMARTNSSTQFSDQYTTSYWNRKFKTFSVQAASNFSNSNTSWAAISGLTLGFLSWDDDGVIVGMCGTFQYSNTNGGNVDLRVDTIQVGGDINPGSVYLGCVSKSIGVHGLSTGYHYVDIFWRQASGVTGYGQVGTETCVTVRA